MLSIPLAQKLLSYLQPVVLERSPSDVSGYLELRLYHNRFQLLTAGAIYSDGQRYFPAVAVARHLGAFLPTVKQVLVLGAGLGSIVQVMRVGGCRPHYTLVEKDEAVLRWTRKVLDEDAQEVFAGQPVDAEAFMAQNRRKYDLIFVDLFAGRYVPDFVTKGAFLRTCRDALSSGGHLALNYVEVDQARWNQLRQLFAEIFPGFHLISRNDNRILISRRASD
jgi:spermidine synthase